MPVLHLHIVEQGQVLAQPGRVEVGVLNFAGVELVCFPVVTLNFDEVGYAFLAVEILHVPGDLFAVRESDVGSLLFGEQVGRVHQADGLFLGFFLGGGGEGGRQGKQGYEGVAGT